MPNTNKMPNSTPRGELSRQIWQLYIRLSMHIEHINFARAGVSEWVGFNVPINTL